MSSLHLNPDRTGPAHGATAATGHPRGHRMGNAVRAVSVFARTAFGEYAEEAGVVRHR
ncbi:hypothetical protein OVA20_15245 [Streptomyces sp. SL294]|uniref:hypothetical protein n=1 Tax=Streptomyces sp. SL294 TaxID=2995144 RepID=UPI002274AA5A|nr:MULTISPECIES: hypothetical protein [unclassified Streptomyces]MCY1652951.1 hypothetical protein [Streptomyces sp. SL203]MCY1679828.1 hypothetical protein [Streptomyces sp. SL294]